MQHKGPKCTPCRLRQRSLDQCALAVGTAVLPWCGYKKSVYSISGQVYKKVWLVKNHFRCTNVLRGTEDERLNMFARKGKEDRHSPLVLFPLRLLFGVLGKLFIAVFFQHGHTTDACQQKVLKDGRHKTQVGHKASKPMYWRGLEDALEGQQGGARPQQDLADVAAWGIMSTSCWSIDLVEKELWMTRPSPKTRLDKRLIVFLVVTLATPR